MSADDVTVGVSIPIPPPYNAVLRDWRRRSGDPLADLVDPHITLVPPTPVPASSLDELLDALRMRCAGFEAFPVRLRGTGSFRPVSDVVFVAIAEGISRCEQLSERVRIDGLRTARPFPYHPHVTVAHDVPAAALDEAFAGLEGFRADVLVREVWAHRQEDDGSWIELSCFPLAAGNQGSG